MSEPALADRSHPLAHESTPHSLTDSPKPQQPVFFDPAQAAAAGRKRLEHSSFMNYLATASTITEDTPELVSSILGMGPLPEVGLPISTSYSPLQLIEDYTGSEGDTPESPISESSEGADHGESSWLFDLIESLSGWLYTSQAHIDFSQNANLHKSRLLGECAAAGAEEKEDLVLSPEDERFWTEWEWVLSRTEEMAIKQTNERSREIDNELKNLRRTANHLKQRPYFVSQAKLVLSATADPSVDEPSQFTAAQLEDLEALPLQASLRSKLLRDVVDQFSDNWLQFIGEVFFHSDSSGDEALPLNALAAEEGDGPTSKKYSVFIENYAEKPYAKNITGALVSMGFVASHGNEQCLTAQVLGDVLWSWWSTLMRSIREILETAEVEEVLAQQLAAQVIRAGPVIARLWLETLQHARGSERTQGLLPEQWRKKELAEQARLNQLRAVGLVDAKFRDGPSQTGCRHSTISPARLADVKARLEERFYSG